MKVILRRLRLLHVKCCSLPPLDNKKTNSIPEGNLNVELLNFEF